MSKYFYQLLLVQMFENTYIRLVQNLSTFLCAVNCKHFVFNVLSVALRHVNKTIPVELSICSYGN